MYKYVCGCRAEVSSGGAWEVQGKRVELGQCPIHHEFCTMLDPLNWSNWNMKYWGSIHEAMNATLVAHSSSLAYEFDSKWKPPIALIATLAARFRTTSMKLHYWSQRQLFYGNVSFDSGRLTEKAHTDTLRGRELRRVD